MTKFNPETCQQIIEGVKAGYPLKTAAAIAGISKSTFYNWIQRGKERKTGKYVDFLDSLKKAKEFNKAYHIDRIRTASDKGNWQASAWYLERVYPNEFGRRNRVEMEHSGEIKQKGKIEVDGKVDVEHEIPGEIIKAFGDLAAHRGTTRNTETTTSEDDSEA